MTELQTIKREEMASLNLKSQKGREGLAKFVITKREGRCLAEFKFTKREKRDQAEFGITKKEMEGPD